jgi:hypothetical protein
MSKLLSLLNTIKYPLMVFSLSVPLLECITLPFPFLRTMKFLTPSASSGSISLFERSRAGRSPCYAAEMLAIFSGRRLALTVPQILQFTLLLHGCSRPIWRPFLGLVRQLRFEAQHDFIPGRDQVDPCLPLKPGDYFILARSQFPYT